MARIGQRLRDARTAKSISLERVAEDTNIGLRYLTGLENDDHSAFPGEPYVVGFMRNYAEYLGLDGVALLADYRRPEAKTGTDTDASNASNVPGEGTPPAEGTIEENAPHAAVGTEASPRKEAPVAGKLAADAVDARQSKASAEKIQAGDASVSANRGSRVMTVVLAVLFVAVLVAALIFLGRKNAGPDETGAAGSELRTAVEYRVEGLPFEKRLYVDDSLVISVGQDLYKIRLAGIDESVNFETPFGPLRIGLGEEGALDPDNDGEADVAIIVTDFAKKNAAAGALVRAESRGSDAADAASASEVQIAPEAAQSATTGSAPTYLFRSTRGPYPFVTTVTFRGPCMFRYEADRREWVEKYYSKGEALTINANNTLVLWASNAQAARVSVQASGGKTADLELGGPGEIAVKRLSWSQAEGAWTLGAADAD